MIDSANRIEQTLQSYQKAINSCQQKLENRQPATKVTATEVKAFLATIKRAKEEHRTAVKTIIAQKSVNAQIAQNTANAIRNFLANLATVKGVVETAAIHALNELEDELDKEEKFLKQEANEYNTVGDIEKGGLDSHANN